MKMDKARNNIAIIYIMAGSLFAVVKEVFTLATTVNCNNVKLQIIIKAFYGTNLTI